MKIEIELQDHIFETLSQSALRRGLSLDEYVRGVLGQVASDETPRAQPMPDVSGMSREMTKVAALQGALNCATCSARLSAAMVERNACEQCGAPIL